MPALLHAGVDERPAPAPVADLALGDIGHPVERGKGLSAIAGERALARRSADLFTWPAKLAA